MFASHKYATFPWDGIVKYDRIQSPAPEALIYACGLSLRYIFYQLSPIMAISLHHVTRPYGCWACTCNKTIYMLANTHIPVESGSLISIMVWIYLANSLHLACRHISHSLAMARGGKTQATPSPLRILHTLLVCLNTIIVP